MRPQIFASPIPVIAVTPPAFECPPSPSTQDSSPTFTEDADSYRPLFLSPPPRISHKPTAPRPQCKPKGLPPMDFETLLAALRKRGASSTKEIVDPVREVTSKDLRKKHDERRARFLAKIGAPPSPTAIHLPVTPPESPALFHFTLPSPGLVSPLALFESLGSEVESKGNTTSWIEQVEFSCARDGEEEPMHSSVLEMRRRSLPSLEDISSHFRMHHTTANTRSRPPLPAFLYARKSPPSSKSPAVPTESVDEAESQHEPKGDSVIPTTTSMVPCKLTEANLIAFERRARATMGLNTLQRRQSLVAACKLRTAVEDRRERRFSAPSQLARCATPQYIPGGF